MLTKEKSADGKPRFSTFMDIAEQFLPTDVDTSLTQEIFNRVELSLVPTWVEKQVDRVLLSQLMNMSVYRELFSFVERGGLYAGDAFLTWIREKLDAGTRMLGTATFADFNQKTGSDLSLVVSDTTGHQMLVLNHRTSPNCPVAWDVRMSMKYSLHLAGSRLEPCLGHLPGQDARRSYHCRRRRAVEFSSAVTHIA